MPTTRCVHSWVSAVIVALGLALPACAQQGDATFTAVTASSVAPDKLSGHASQVMVPAPPRSLSSPVPSHHPVIPAPGPDHGLPQPDSSPTRVADPAELQRGTGQFRFFNLELVRPSGFGGSSAGTPEPANGMLRDTVLQTGNAFAALSPDNGSSWSYINPYTFFPAIYGGFCCDQQVIDVPSHGLVVWLLLYASTSAGNAIRIAVSRSRDDLRTRDPADWVSWTFTPQTNFGYGRGIWLDYPDIAFDSQWLYVRANAIGGPDSAVIWRVKLDDMRAGGNVAVQYTNTAAIGGWGHRLAKGASTMAFAAYKTVTEMYVYTWPPTTSVITRSTQPIAVWNGGPVSVPGPDGRDWAGSWPNVGAIIGAYGNATEAGFMWGCGPRSGRPRPYVRVARFRLSDRSRIAEHDIWNANDAFLYPDGMSNARGDVGGVIACGSATRHVTVGNFLIDGYDAWPPDTVWLQGTGTSGPDQNRFGDYFTVRRHPVQQNTFLSSGSHQVGGPTFANSRSMFSWFGRDDDEPTWVSLAVRSNLSAVPMTIDATDLDGNKNGPTDFSRRFAPHQGYELTAPLTRSVGLTTYAFERWRLTTQPRGTPILFPIGDRVLTVASIITTNDVAEALYVRSRTLTVRSTNPTSGVAVTITPPDYTGRIGGSTTFTTVHRDGDPVTLIAPSSVGSNPFRRWSEGTTQHPIGQLTVQVTMSGNRALTAEYWQPVAGSVANLGPGCPGSSQPEPRHDIAWPSGQQGPAQGSPTYYGLTRARANTDVVLLIGGSRTTYGGLVLPLDLGPFGLQGCRLFHDIVVQLPTRTSVLGTARVPITWPVDPSTVGGHSYSSFLVVDPGVPSTLPLALSTSLDTTMGGLRE